MTTANLWPGHFPPRSLSISRLWWWGKGWSEKTYLHILIFDLIQYWSVLTQIRSSLCPPPPPQPSQRCDQHMFDSDDPEELSRVKTLDKRATRLPHFGGKGAGHKGAGAKAWLCQMKIKSLPDALNYIYMLYRSRKTIFKMTLECLRLFSTSVTYQNMTYPQKLQPVLTLKFILITTVWSDSK